MNPQLLDYAQDWTQKTERFLKARVDKFQIKGRGLLKNSIQARLKTEGSKIVITIDMRTSGKFVDMGAGRGQTANTKTTARKQKKWVNKFLYGRMYALQKVAAIEVKEMAKRIFREE
jgi:hypothetical protein